MLATAWFATQVLLFASFKIPSDSMEPELQSWFEASLRRS